MAALLGKWRPPTGANVCYSMSFVQNEKRQARWLRKANSTNRGQRSPPPPSLRLQVHRHTCKMSADINSASRSMAFVAQTSLSWRREMMNNGSLSGLIWRLSVGPRAPLSSCARGAKTHLGDNSNVFLVLCVYSRLFVWGNSKFMSLFTTTTTFPFAIETIRQLASLLILLLIASLQGGCKLQIHLPSPVRSVSFI